MGQISIKVYEYKACSTCRKALQYLDGKKVVYQKLPIVEQPPTKAELKKMLGFIKKRDVKKRDDLFKDLFNTSGVQYRELGISHKIKAGMTEEQAMDLLAKNGKLIKRPFLLLENDGAVGFKPELWSEILS
ncbi:MAG: Spx/MgsR family RNA polymerase-binding regulatory protein [Bdellovibrionales bacterium]|jgi:Spx/MgsR family transcriptional regulator|nr:Spx/MgsR family RNA polymerase-binding regulatory protein [Bdellovibrionales bacterium]